MRIEPEPTEFVLVIRKSRVAGQPPFCLWVELPDYRERLVFGTEAELVHIKECLEMDDYFLLRDYRGMLIREIKMFASMLAPAS